MFCNQNTRMCQAVALQGETCISTDQCDMALVCKFDSNLATKGICQPYFSLSTSTPVYAKTGSDLSVCADGFGTLDIISSTVVEINKFVPGLYRCGKALSSLNAGQPCNSYLDCPSSSTGVYAQCSCTYASYSKKCDILVSNVEYQEYVSAAKDFQKASAYCHNARNLGSGPCDQLDLFGNMMCKKMKAIYYLYNLNVKPCVETYSNQVLFPEIDETQLWCNPDRYAVLLGLNNSLYNALLSYGLLAIYVVSLTLL